MELPDEKYSLEVRRIVAEEAARASFDEAVEQVKKQSGAEVPKRQAEELAVRAARDFDEFYRSRLREPEDTEQLLVLSFDAKGIATLHRELREATRKKAEKTTHRLETRLSKGEKPNRKRMADVATVYSIDTWPRTIADVLHGVHDKHEKKQRRPRPINKRVWASIVHEHQRDHFAVARAIGVPRSQRERPQRARSGPRPQRTRSARSRSASGDHRPCSTLESSRRRSRSSSPIAGAEQTAPRVRTGYVETLPTSGTEGRGQPS